MMLIEYRAYTLKRRKLGAFWDAQIDRGFDAARPIMERLIGYFSTQVGGRPVVVHLYAFENYDDWFDRLHGLYRAPAVQRYLAHVRTLMHRQENMFLGSAPVATAFNWPASDQRSFGPVHEHTIDLRPGALRKYCEAWDALLASDPSRAETIYGLYFTLAGPLNRVKLYACQPIETEHLAARQPEGAEPLVIRQTSRRLRPAPVAEMSPHFAVRVRDQHVERNS